MIDFLNPLVQMSESCQVNNLAVILLGLIAYLVGPKVGKKCFVDHKCKLLITKLGSLFVLTQFWNMADQP